ncbi:hypothetical protein GMB80_12040 [Turicibacter sanguinis]|nr:hypothetical protein [Turicibacter sanguinis]
MLVECKSFLSDVKELKMEILDWIREFGTEYSELTERLESDLLKKIDGYIKTLEEMKPGTIVEVR